MNRSQYEIDHGYIPANFRDGVNPDARDEPRKMDWKSHGFRFLLQTHDSFTVELNLNHAKWQEAVINLLHDMERPCTINGHRVSVKTEAEFGRRDRKSTSLNKSLMRISYALFCLKKKLKQSEHNRSK